MTIKRQELPQAQPSTYDRAELHGQQAAVITPLEQAAITGVLVAVFVGMVAWLFDVGWLATLKAGAVSGVTATLGAWAALHFRWIRITDLEKYLGDLNGDSIIGPPTAPITYTVNTFDGRGHMTAQAKYTFTSVSPEQIKLFCIKVRKLGKPISRRAWTPKQINGFSDDEWRPFYGELSQQKLIRVVGSRCEFTEEGEQWADGILAADDPHYSPSEEAATEAEIVEEPPTHPPSTHKKPRKTS